MTRMIRIPSLSREAFTLHVTLAAGLAVAVVANTAFLLSYI